MPRLGLTFGVVDDLPMTEPCIGDVKDLCNQIPPVRGNVGHEWCQQQPIQVNSILLPFCSLDV